MPIISTRDVPGKAPRFKNAAPVLGDDGQMVLAVLYDNGNNGTFIEVWRTNAAGVWEQITSRQATHPTKWDSIGAMRVFNNLFVFPCAHILNLNTRTNFGVEVFFNIFT
jgi:hypothetical protein